MREYRERAGSFGEVEDHFYACLERARAGDDHAIDEFLPALRRAMKQHARRTMRGSSPPIEDDSDFVQRALTQGALHIEEFEGDSYDSFRGWFLQILRNDMKATLRRHHASKRDVRREVCLDAAPGQALATDDPSPLDALSTKETAEGVRREIESCPPRVRRLLRELRKHDATVTTAAKKAGVARRTAYRWLASLRDKFAKYFWADEVPPPKCAADLHEVTEVADDSPSLLSDCCLSVGRATFDRVRPQGIRGVNDSSR
jgi:RNA polymerase sigma factor (sigma-70 family)